MTLTEIKKWKTYIATLKNENLIAMEQAYNNPSKWYPNQLKIDDGLKASYIRKELENRKKAR